MRRERHPPYSISRREKFADAPLCCGRHAFGSPHAADAIHLKGLLARRTLHSTFPNIIIGSRSIGGADDLERLEREGTLTKLLEEATAV